MIELKRDVVATTIPYGQKTTLTKGSQVEITQELGGSFTVLTDYGLLRVEGKDSDALGRESAAKQTSAAEMPGDAKTVATEVWNQLKTRYDPEIPGNLGELGLVHRNKVEPIPEGGFRVDVKFTLTAPGCGMGPILQSEVRDKVLNLPGVKFANIEVVFEPPWTQSMMSDAAKLQLGMM